MNQCDLCDKVALYEVPVPNKEYYCGDHEDVARARCKATCGMWDRVHYPDGIGKPRSYSERIWR